MLFSLAERFAFFVSIPRDVHHGPHAGGPVPFSGAEQGQRMGTGGMAMASEPRWPLVAIVAFP